ncbi:MAG: glycosyltransferase family 2 protein [Nitrospiraceae bacterium]|nr:glycosyltransferase family 2 protein [Nitrospiraceae bacterium]
MISTIIVNYNSAHLTEKAVGSVLQEDEESEVFVVDNTAEPEEKERLRAMFEGRPVTLLFNETNEGFGRACNRAYTLCRGKYIFLLNPDAYIVPPCLRTMRKFLEDRPDVGSVSPLLFWDSFMTYYFPQSLLPSPGRDLAVKLSCLSPVFASLYSLSERNKNLALWRSSSPIRVKNISGGTAFLRRTAIEDCGGLFDERFFLFYEDSDLFLRMQKKGYRLYVVPLARAVHRHSHSVEKLDIMSRTRELYYEKHFNGHFMHRLVSLIPGASQSSTCVDFGSWSSPPLFQVPARFRGRYLFEFSPSPLFLPSVGYFGSGENLAFSREIWDSIDKGEYYCRFTDGGKKLTSHTALCWRKT